MIACHAGALSAEPTPIAKVSARSVRGPVAPAMVRPPSAAAATSIHHCVASSRRRRSTTSASAPAGSARRKKGRLVAVCTSATMRGEGVSDVMSHTAPTFCIHVPTFEATPASQRLRKAPRRRSGVQSEPPAAACSPLAAATLAAHGCPPSIRSTAPVVKLDASDAK